MKSHCCCAKLPKNAHHLPTGTSIRGVWPTDTFQPARPSVKLTNTSFYTRLWMDAGGIACISSKQQLCVLPLLQSLAHLNFTLRNSVRCSPLLTPTKKNLHANTQKGKVVYESIRVARKIQFAKIPCHNKVYQSGDCVTLAPPLLIPENATLVRGIRKLPIKQHIIIWCWEDFPSVGLQMNAFLHPKKYPRSSSAHCNCFLL